MHADHIPNEGRSASMTASDDEKKLAEVYDTIRQVSSIAKMTEVFLDNRAETSSLPLSTDFYNASYSLGALQRLLAGALTTIDEVEFNLRRAAR